MHEGFPHVVLHVREALLQLALETRLQLQRLGLGRLVLFAQRFELLDELGVDEVRAVLFERGVAFLRQDFRLRLDLLHGGAEEVAVVAGLLEDLVGFLLHEAGLSDHVCEHVVGEGQVVRGRDLHHGGEVGVELAVPG